MKLSRLAIAVAMSVGGVGGGGGGGVRGGGGGGGGGAGGGGGGGGGLFYRCYGAKKPLPGLMVK